MKKQKIMFTSVLLALACFALSPAARAVYPTPGGGYPGANTAEGENALYTATGSGALMSNTTGSTNTATGASALHDTTTGSQNTAIGSFALISTQAAATILR